jgi:hypothetical protein
MGIYPEFIGCQSPPAISFVDRDARVCLAIQDASSTPGNVSGSAPAGIFASMTPTPSSSYQECLIPGPSHGLCRLSQKQSSSQPVTDPDLIALGMARAPSALLLSATSRMKV